MSAFRERESRFDRTPLLKRGWLLVLASILMVVHGIVFYRLLSTTAWTIAVSLILLVLLKHIGVFGAIYDLLRRRTRNSASSRP